MNSHNVWRINYKLSIFFANSLWIHHLCREFTINSWLCYEFTMDLLPSSRFTMNLLRLDIIWMVSHNAIKIGIRWLTLSFYEPSKLYLVLVFREYTMNSPSVSRIYYKFTVFIKNLIRIHLKFPFFRESTMNQRDFLRINYQLTFANLLWIHNLYRGFIKNSLGVWGIYYEFAIHFTK